MREMEWTQDAPKRDNQTLDDWVKVYLPCQSFKHEKGGEKIFCAPGTPLPGG